MSWKVKIKVLMVISKRRYLKHLIFSQKFQILATGSKLENCGSSRSKVCGPTLN